MVCPPVRGDNHGLSAKNEELIMVCPPVQGDNHGLSTCTMS